MTDQGDGGSVPHPKKPSRSSTIAIFAAATLLALVISVPAIAVSAIMYYILKTGLLLTLIASLATFFVAMGFGYKLSGRLARIQRTYSNESGNNNK